MNRNRKIVSLATSLCLLAVMGVYVAFHRDEMTAIMSVSIFHLFMLVFLAALFIGLLGLTNKCLVAVFGVKLSVTEWFGLSVLTAVGNYFIPLRGGASVRAVYLKKKYQFPFSRFLSTMMGLYLLTFWIACTIGIVLCCLIYLVHDVFNLYIAVPLTGICIMTSFFMLFTPRVPETPNRLLKFLKEIVNGWEKIKQDRPLIRNLTLLSLAGYAVKALQLFFAYRALNFHVSFLGVSLLSVLLVFMVFINLTPANVGVQEGMISFFSAVFGMGFNQGLLAALIFRSSNMLIAFGLSPIFSYLLLREKSVRAGAKSNKTHRT